MGVVRVASARQCLSPAVCCGSAVGGSHPAAGGRLSPSPLSLGAVPWFPAAETLRRPWVQPCATCGVRGSAGAVGDHHNFKLLIPQEGRVNEVFRSLMGGSRSVRGCPTANFPFEAATLQLGPRGGSRRHPAVVWSSSGDELIAFKRLVLRRCSTNEYVC